MRGFRHLIALGILGFRVSSVRRVGVEGFVFNWRYRLHS